MKISTRISTVILKPIVNLIVRISRSSGSGRLGGLEGFPEPKESDCLLSYEFFSIFVGPRIDSLSTKISNFLMSPCGVIIKGLFGVINPLITVPVVVSITYRHGRLNFIVAVFPFISVSTCFFSPMSMVSMIAFSSRFQFCGEKQIYRYSSYHFFIHDQPPISIYSSFSRVHLQKSIL